jgi:subfamily B ATP-binding cassette protein MsbA
VLRKLTLTIKKSKMTAIVGRSGSGKTTLINILMRMYECPPGKVFFDGVDIRDYTTASIRDGIAYVSQEPLLFNDTLRKNLIYGMEDKVSDEDINKAIAKAKLLQFLKSLPAGLETIVGDRGTRLSGGERQRVAIARAILKNAGILILDEATSSVDLHTEMLLQSDIEELTRGRTTIVIAHRLSTIKKADWIIVLNGGRVVEEGDMETLLAKKGVFHKHWTEQKFTNDESFQTISVA